MKQKMITMFVCILMLVSLKINSQTIQIDVDHPTAKIQPTMWGIFFEDINLAADG